MNSFKVNFIKIFSIVMVIVVALANLAFCWYFDLGFISLFVYIFILALYFFIHTIGHELGHLIAGLISGYEFLVFRVFDLAITSTDEGLKIKRYKIPGTLGQCLMAPSDDMEPDDYPYIFYNLGGVLANIILSILALILGIYLGYPYILQSLAFIAIGLILIANNIIPIEGFANDGSNIKALNESRLARISMFELLVSTKDSIKGESPRLSQIDFMSLPFDSLKDSLVQNNALNQIEALIYYNKLPQAMKLGEFMVSLPFMMDIFSQQFKLELASIYLVLGLDDKLEILLKDKNFLSQIHSSTNMLTDRTSFIYYLLYEKNEEKAGEFLDRFNKNKDSYPFLTEVGASKKMIKRAIKSYKYEKVTLELDHVDSTNDLAKSMAEEDSDKRIIIARSQSSGRGQRDKTFISPEGGLYMSVILRPKYGPDQLKYISGRVGLAIVETLKEGLGVDSQVKWINDIIYKDKKLGGVLVESSIEENNIDYLIIGLGLNIESSDKIRDYAYLDLPYEKSIKIINYYLLDKLFEIEKNPVDEEFFENYNKHLYKKSESIEFIKDDQVHEGILEGIDKNMNLVIDNRSYKYGQIKIIM